MAQKTSASKPLDVLRLSATEAVHLLETGATTSVALVEAYLSQITKHNHSGLNLNAIISTAPRNDILRRAHILDTERQAGELRGPLHGIPFIAKDTFITHPDLGMPSTAGAPCFASAQGKRTAPLIQHLLDAGMLLLGKANMTEFCGLKMKGLTPGFSPMGGQTQNPYIFGGLEDGEKLLGHSCAGGSSSGSASGVAAGFAPLSIGTECCGSLITPANRAGLYALKCGLGEVDVRGCFRYTDCTDYVGGMAKTVRDLGGFVWELMQREHPFELGGGFEGLRVVFTDVKEWRLPDEICDFSGDIREQMEKGYEMAKKRMAKSGAIVLDADLPVAWDAFKINGKSPWYEIAFYQLKNKHLPEWFNEFEDREVRNLEEMIKYNEDHADKCMPPAYPRQDELHDLLANGTTADECQEMIDEMRRRAKQPLDRVFQTADVIVALADSPLCMYSSAAGCPIACCPLGTVKYSEQNERPYGLCMMAPRGGEEVLLRFMAAFEAAFPGRPLPRPLL